MPGAPFENPVLPLRRTLTRPTFTDMGETHPSSQYTQSSSPRTAPNCHPALAPAACCSSPYQVRRRSGTSTRVCTSVVSMPRWLPSSVSRPLSSPPCLLPSHLPPLSASWGNIAIFMSHAAYVEELWRGMVALGVYDPALWDAWDLAWEVVLGAMGRCAA
ncbi:hypothetical protein C8R45DRAFT_1107640 [Mycena sanguinolenta]|nr:hypothetical protein C8R45DRAFT_1107640 [Mycena sanguinolenta]